jgi:pyridoxal phosphate enzyme (YggS family)
MNKISNELSNQSSNQSSNQIQEAYGRIQEKVELYSKARLIAVSKRQPIERIKALVALGHKDFGENYLQEWVDKKSSFPNDIQWHFIGQLQSRKLKSLISEQIFCIHSLGSRSAFEKLSKQEELPKGGVLLQVNLAGEEQKGGVGLAEIEMMKSEGLLDGCRGIMSIPPSNWDRTQLKAHFKSLKQLKDQLGFEELSMGMSSDWELALDEGSTMIRVGSALFGERTS